MALSRPSTTPPPEEFTEVPSFASPERMMGAGMAAAAAREGPFAPRPALRLRPKARHNVLGMADLSLASGQAFVPSLPGELATAAAPPAPAFAAGASFRKRTREAAPATEGQESADTLSQLARRLVAMDAALSRVEEDLGEARAAMDEEAAGAEQAPAFLAPALPPSQPYMPPPRGGAAPAPVGWREAPEDEGSEDEDEEQEDEDEDEDFQGMPRKMRFGYRR
jgi:hypothetical protein